jgi:hypothetical protein
VSRCQPTHLYSCREFWCVARKLTAICSLSGGRSCRLCRGYYYYYYHCSDATGPVNIELNLAQSTLPDSENYKQIRSTLPHIKLAATIFAFSVSLHHSKAYIGIIRSKLEYLLTASRPKIARKNVEKTLWPNISVTKKNRTRGQPYPSYFEFKIRANYYID